MFRQSPSLRTASQVAASKTPTVEVEPYSSDAVEVDPLCPIHPDEMKNEGLRERRIGALVSGGYFRDRTSASRFVLELVNQANGSSLSPGIAEWIEKCRADNRLHVEREAARDAAMARIAEHDRLREAVVAIDTRLQHERGALASLDGSSASTSEAYIAWGGHKEPGRLDAFLLLQAKIAAGKAELPNIIKHFERELEAAKTALAAFEAESSEPEEAP